MNRIFTLCMMLLLQMAAHAQGINGTDYNPENPPGPHEDGYADTWPLVNLTVVPDWVGGTSLGTADNSEVGNHVEAGKEVTVNAYAKTSGFSFRAWVAEGDTVSKQAKYTFTMPTKDVNLCAVFDYTPDSPEHPHANVWNKESGELIITDFEPGRLSWQIGEVTRRDPWSSYWELIKNATVAGKASNGDTTNNDWEAFGNATNMEFLDMSRTSGLSIVTAYCFSGYGNLRTLVMPATTTAIGIEAFRDCHALSEITCFATTPPEFKGELPGEEPSSMIWGESGPWAFNGLTLDNIIVHVPAESVPLYQEARGWKQFMILPITQGVQRLTVNLPQAAQYKDMFLELANAQTGQSTRYVITANTTYTFPNLIRDTRHNLYIKNQRGTVMGIISGIDIVNEDVTVNFADLKAPRDVKLRLTLPNGSAASDNDYSATWTDRVGNYLGAGATLNCQADGAQVVCHIRLGETLGHQYQQPADTVYTVGQNSVLSLNLKVIPTRIWNGTVVAKNGRQPLRGATVTVNQTLNGQYTVTQTTRTDVNGLWTMTVFDAPTTITAQATDYIPRTDTLAVGTTPADTIALRDLTGTYVRLDLYYRPALADGETDDSEDNGFSDYQNIEYSVYDVTHGCGITETLLQYPHLVLVDNVLEKGTRLRLTASSKVGLFNTIEATCSVDSAAQAVATIPIIQRGGVVAVVGSTDNSALTGMLFNSTGQLAASGTYNSMYDAQGRPALPFHTLPDGHYTLVSMGNSRCFNNVGSLDALNNAGLRNGIDYVATDINIRSEHIDSLFIATVPVFDETRFYSTGPATRFSSNKSGVTAGQYVTLSTQVDFKEGVTPSDVHLVFDLKDGCQMVANSMMVGTHVAPCQVEGNTVSVALDDVSQLVRFCIVPTESGMLQPSASVVFKMGDKTVTQPIGTVAINVSNLTLSAPETTGRALIPVTGTAIPMSDIQVYDSDVLIGQTVALGNGTWKAQCTLNRPYNLSEHTIYAVVTTPEGVQMKSESQTVKFDKGNFTPVVTMTLQSTDYEHKAIVIDFDFRTMKPSQNYYDMRGMGRVHCTYKVNFMDSNDQIANDTTAAGDVVLYVLMEDRRTINRHEAHYSDRYKCWFADTEYDYWNLPVYVDATWKVLTDVALDRSQVDDALKDLEDAYDENRRQMKELYDAFDKEGELPHINEYAELDQLLELDSLTSEQRARVDELLGAIVGDSLMTDGATDLLDFSEVEALEAQIDPQSPDLTLMSQIDKKLIDLQKDLFDKADRQRAEYESAMQAILLEESGFASQMQALRDSLFDFLSLYLQTDTAALQKPEGETAYSISYGDLTKSYEVRHLDYLDAEQLIADGYMEIPMTDGTAFFMKKNEEGYSLIDTRNATLYRMKPDGPASYNNSMAARALAGKWNGKFQIFNDDCVNKATDYFKLFWKYNEQLKQAQGDWANFSAIAGNVCPIFKKSTDILGCLYESGRKNSYQFFLDLFAKSGKESQDLMKITQRWEKETMKMIVTQNRIVSAAERAGERLNQRLMNYGQMLSDTKDPNIRKEILASIDALKEQLSTNGNKTRSEKELLKVYEGNLKTIQKELSQTEKVVAAILNQKGKLIELYKKYPAKFKDALKIGRKIINITGWVSKFVGTVIGSVLQIVPLGVLAYDNAADIAAWLDLEKEVLAYLPCEGDRDKWEEIYKYYKDQAQWDITTDVLQFCTDAASLCIDGADFPVVTPQWWLSTLMDIASLICAVTHPEASERGRNHVRWRLNLLDCNKKPKPGTPKVTTKPLTPAEEKTKKSLDEGYRNGDYNLNQLIFLYQLLGVVRDPSGYVYEAVSSNRIEGVRTTCYYKEQKEDMYGDLYDDVVFWDAENYEQENPLYTDADGRYAWDVPTGLWQVKYEKDGYETTYSDWLPVPPPQLEVNVGITQLRQPAVKKVVAYKNAVEVEFDKYMTPSTLTADNISLTKGGQTVSGTLQLMNAEAGYQKPDEQYASRVAFVPTQPLTFNERVVLTIRRAVESYAGLKMESDFQQEFTVSNDTLPVERDTTDVDSTAMTVATPTASRISGTTVARGTTVTLSCSTPGATIWYTTDGTCPCDENGSRLRYTSPIAINAHLLLKAYAVRQPMLESEIATFEYFVAAENQRVTTSSAGYATFYSSESSYALPAGLSAQVVTSVTNKKLTYRTIAEGSNNGVIPQGVPVMLINSARSSASFTLTPAASYTSTYNGENLLRGSDVATTTHCLPLTTQHYYYKLTFGSGAQRQTFGWFWGAANGGAFRIDGHRAWLAVPAAAATRGFSVDGIMEFDDTTTDENLLYDLQGRRVDDAAKQGVYIRNNKKIVIK